MAIVDIGFSNDAALCRVGLDFPGFRLFWGFESITYRSVEGLLSSSLVCC